MRAFATLFLALFAASCAATDKALVERQTPAAPEAWAAMDAPGDEAPVDWLATFEDEELNAIVAEAMTHNRDLGAAAARFQQARAGATSSRADLFPQIDASIDTTRQGIFANAFADPTQTAGDNRLYTTSYGLSLRASWELDVWGRLTDAARAGYKDYKAAGYDLAAARQSIAGTTAQAWFAFIEARLQTELAERDVERAARSLSVVERRYDRGVSQSLDVRLSRSALANSEASLALRRRVEQEAARRLEVLIGRYPEARLTAAETLPPLPSLSGVGAPGDILARRPDLAAAEERLEAAGLRAREARKAMLPRLTLTSSISSSAIGSTTPGGFPTQDFSDIFDINQMTGNLIAGLAQPVFQGGRLVANANRQRAAAEEAVYSYAATALAAYEEAENALAAEDALFLREDALKAAYEETREAAVITERQYANGVATIFELLDAQSRQINAESQYISVRTERLTNRVRLLSCFRR